MTSRPNNRNKRPTTATNTATINNTTHQHRHEYHTPRATPRLVHLGHSLGLGRHDAVRPPRLAHLPSRARAPRQLPGKRLPRHLLPATARRRPGPTPRRTTSPLLPRLDQHLVAVGIHPTHPRGLRRRLRRPYDRLPRRHQRRHHRRGILLRVQQHRLKAGTGPASSHAGRHSGRNRRRCLRCQQRGGSGPRLPGNGGRRRLWRLLRRTRGGIQYPSPRGVLRAVGVAKLGPLDAEERAALARAEGAVGLGHSGGAGNAEPLLAGGCRV